MTLYNLIQWTQEVLTDYQLPDTLDRDTLNETIFLRCGELDIVWSSPTIATGMIKTWFKANYVNFTRLAKTMTLDYNPIHNMDYDVTSNGVSSSEAGSNTEHKVSAYNASIYTPDSESVNSTNAHTQTGAAEHRSGLSGMYAYQDLVDKERETAAWSIYDYIAKQFELAHCISVY